MVKNKLSLTLTIILVLQFTIINAETLLKQDLNIFKQNNYTKVLENVKPLSNNPDIDNLYTNLLSQTEDDIINFFAEDITSIPQYWEKYYLLSKLIFFSGKKWSEPSLTNIDDAFYKKLVDQNKKYSKGIGICKESSSEINLEESEYGYKKLEEIEKNSYFQHIQNQLPKGIIHHLHWSASVNYKGVYQSIQSLYKQPFNLESVLIISTKIETQFNNQFTGKFFYQYLLTKQKYLNTQLTPQNIYQFKKLFQIDNKCLSNPINNEYGVFQDQYLKGYYYLNLCDESKVYSPQAQQYVEPMSELKKLIKSSMGCFESDQEAINGLPAQYVDQVQDESSEQKVLGIWYRFEQTFTAFGEILNQITIKESFTKLLFKTLSSQKTYGIEIRNRELDDEIQLLNRTSAKYNIPFDYIIPGRKVNGTGSNLDYLINDDRNKGIDFVGFEDEPFNGSRNFFSATLIQNNNQDDFEKLFNALKSGKSLYLHAGETPFFPDQQIDKDYADNNYINDNIIHAALLPSVKRVGHGFAAAKSNLLLHIFQRKNISFEFNPVSNQILKYTKINVNPFLRMLRNGIPVTISPDDPGLFGYTGVSQDWFQIMMQTDIKPSEIYLLLKYSIQYSSIPSVQGNNLLIQRLQKDLELFFKTSQQACQSGYKQSFLPIDFINKFASDTFNEENNRINNSSSIYSAIISLILLIVIF